jgi:hypothetical protein
MKRHLFIAIDSIEAFAWICKGRLNQMNLRVLIFLLGACLAMPLWAQNWRLIGKNENVEIYIDAESLKQDQGSLRINSYRNILSNNNLEFKSIENEFSFNCSDASYKELAPLLFSDFNRGGRLIARGAGSQERKVENFNTALGAMYKFACNSGATFQAQLQKNTLVGHGRFKYIGELNESQLQLLIRKSFVNDDLYGNFLFNFAFIHSINALMQSNPGNYYDYLNYDGRRVFNPQRDDIRRNFDLMLELQREMASALQVNSDKLHRTIGIKFVNQALSEEGDKNISQGRLMSERYWRAAIVDDDAKRYWGRDYNANIHRPRPDSRLNDFYHNKTPDELFKKWYPEYIAQIKNIVIPNLVKLAEEFEKKQEAASVEREKRNQWLQTPEGRRYLEQEEEARKNAIKARDDELRRKYSSKESIIDMRNRSSMAGSCFMLLQGTQNFREADKASRWSNVDGLRYAEGMGRASEAFTEAPRNIFQAALSHCLIVFK